MTTRTAAGAARLQIAGPERWGRAWRSWPAMTAASVLAAGALVRFGVTPRGVTMACFVTVLVVLSAIDLEKRILPNAIVLPSAMLVLAAQVASDPDRAPEWILAAVGSAALLLILLLANPAGMGMGDVKLAGLLGAALGKNVMTALVIGPASVLPVALWMMLSRGAGARKATIPFGPFLAFGAVAAALLGSASG
jgi:leader peptidase (prepilin peptidase)/N-methyltransferase